MGELLTVRQRDGSTIALEGELDLSNVEVFTAVLNPCCRDMDEHLSLDLSRLTFLDVSGLRALAQAAQTLDGRGKSWVLVSPSPLIRRLLELTGLLPAMANLKIQ